MTAEWRPIPGWEGLYEASSDGQVRSLDRFVSNGSGGARRVRGYLLRQRPNHQGYMRVNLARDGLHHTCPVHQLIALTFKGPRPDGMVTMHLDGDAKNNSADNLEYGTQSENLHDCVAHGNHRLANLTACLAGHEFTPENTRIRPRGGRTCRACDRARAARRRDESREAA